MVEVVDQIEERPILEPLLIDAELAGDTDGGRADDAVATQQHRDRCGVLHQRSQSSRLAGHLPATTLGQIAHAQQDLVADHRSEHLDQSPPFGAADPELHRTADGLALHTLQREQRHLQVVRVQEVQAAQADRLFDRASEQRSCRGVRPAQARLVVDQHDRIGQSIEDVGVHVRCGESFGHPLSHRPNGTVH